MFSRIVWGSASIGALVDQVSYGAAHKFLPCVANHETGGIVWVAEGRNAASLHAFFDGLAGEQKASIKALSIDLSAGYENAIRDPAHGLPHARVCFDPIPRCPARWQGRVQPARPLLHGRGQVDQGRTLQPAQGTPRTRRPSSCSSWPRWPYGFRSADALIAMIYLRCAGITIALPHR